MDDVVPAPRSRKTSGAVFDRLRRLIEEGFYAPGCLLPTERELQAEYGASRTTIRRALSLLVDQGHVINLPSRGVIVGSSSPVPNRKTVAFIDGTSYVLRNLFVVLSSLLRDEGMHLVHLSLDQMTMEEAVDYARQHQFCAALVWDAQGFPDTRRILEGQYDLPIIALDHRIRGLDSDVCTFDYFEAARIATGHLIAQGRSRIAVSGMMDMLDTSHERFCGVMKAIFENHMAFDPLNIQYTFTSGCRIQEFDLLRQRMSLPFAPDGLVVLQDEFTPGIVESLLGAGIRIPEDLAVITIGDELELSVGDCGLSTIRLDWAELAQLAVEALLARLQEPTKPFQRRFAGHELVIRGLCGAHPYDWIEPARRPSQYTAIEGQRPKPRYRFLTELTSSLTGPGSQQSSMKSPS